jgi:hypothetical protein
MQGFGEGGGDSREDRFVHGVAADTSGTSIAEFDNHRAEDRSRNGSHHDCGRHRGVGNQWGQRAGNTAQLLDSGRRRRRPGIGTSSTAPVFEKSQLYWHHYDSRRHHASGFDGDNGPATSAHLNFPPGIALDSSANLTSRIPTTSGFGSHRSHRIITTIAATDFGFSGDNRPAIAQLNAPPASDRSRRQRTLPTAPTIVIERLQSPLVSSRQLQAAPPLQRGNGPATSAALSITGLKWQRTDGRFVGNVYFADSSNRIRKISAATGGSRSPAAASSAIRPWGDGGAAPAAQLWVLDAVVVDASASIADSFNFRTGCQRPRHQPC